MQKMSKTKMGTKMTSTSGMTTKMPRAMKMPMGTMSTRGLGRDAREGWLRLQLNCGGRLHRCLYPTTEVGAPANGAAGTSERG